MTNKEIRIRHFYNEANQLTSTIATFEKDGNVIVAVARCNPKERNCSKRAGRQIAIGRLQAYIKGRQMDRNITVMPRTDFINWLRGEF